LRHKDLLLPYNPWWENPEKAFERLPSFRRPAFLRIYRDLKQIPQIISITGPRRVGKSTLIRQMIQELLTREDVKADHVMYYSMDDPALLRAALDADGFFSSLMDYARKHGDDHPFYVFLDEIQRFERWELFLKKYYDLNYPVRFVVSGSASSPIFKKSRESLLGRVKDYHLLPFSFREFLMYEVRSRPDLVSENEEIHRVGASVMGMFAEHPEYAELQEVKIPALSPELKSLIDLNLIKFLMEGGFPEVWSLPDWETKQSYLFDNQVGKVISEDLVLAVELRKPELLKRFFISLLEYPGREISFQQLSKDLGMSRQTIEKYFPLLEMTDLIRRVERFTKSPLRVRQGNIKCYLVDLALRNAVLRIQDSLLQDDQVLGLYAENLVFNALKKWEGTVNINYFKQKKYEIDFIVHAGAGKYIPIEVKYRDRVDKADFRTIRNFCTTYKCGQGIIVTKNWDDFGNKERLFHVPLPHFLLLFD
jgi:uncharacterized protein